MNIFELHRDVLADYRDFVRSFLMIADEKARRFVDKALEEEARLWPDFLVQVSPSYATASWTARGENCDSSYLMSSTRIGDARARTWPCWCDG